MPYCTLLYDTISYHIQLLLILPSLVIFTEQRSITAPFHQNIFIIFFPLFFSHSNTHLYHTVLHCFVLYCTVLHSTVLYCIVLYYAVLYCTVLNCTVLYCTVLYCTILCCTVPYCIRNTMYRNGLYKPFPSISYITCCTASYYIIPYNNILHHTTTPQHLTTIPQTTTPHHSSPHHTIPYHTILYYTILYRTDKNVQKKKNALLEFESQKASLLSRGLNPHVEFRTRELEAEVSIAII